MTNTSTPTQAPSFWFHPMSSVGFGLMRIIVGFSMLSTFLMQLGNYDRYYGPHGIVPHENIAQFMRSGWRVSILDWSSLPWTYALLGIFLIAMFLVMIGLFTRPALAVSIILLASFHEYATIILDGGDTLQRLLLFILFLSPCERSFSLDNLRCRLRAAREEGRSQDPAERQMPMWPYRLLLWQMIILYSAAAFDKWHGTMWRSGTAVGAVLHHPHFSRLPVAVADWLSIMSPFITYLTLITQSMWWLLLLAGLFEWAEYMKPWVYRLLRRFLLIVGFFIHGAIFLFMDVGTFSITVFASYIGLLVDEDFDLLRGILNKKFIQKTTLFYDGRCGLCSTSMVMLESLDWLHRIDRVNLYDREVCKKFLPHVQQSELEESMHVLRRGTTTKGFEGWRTLAWDIPVLWVLIPFLHLPGVGRIGERTYEWVARKRG